MKRTKILIISILVCAILVSTVIYSIEKKKFINKNVLLEAQFGSQILSEMCDQVFYRTQNFPKSMDEIISIFREDGIDEVGINQAFIDPFNRDHDYYTYAPLYNRKNRTREGYMLFSAGIDGKVNNRLRDTVFIDEDIPLKIYSVSDTSFNIFRKWFGKKDLLIFRKIGREMLIKYAGYPISPVKNAAEVIELGLKVKKRRDFVMNKYLVTFHILYKGKIICKDSASVYFQFDDLWIYNRAYDPHDYLKYNVGDSIKLTGTLNGWMNDKLINITNCIPVD